MSCIKICDYISIYLDRFEKYLDKLLLDCFHNNKIIDLEEVKVDSNKELINLNDYTLL